MLCTPLKAALLAVLLCSAASVPAALAEPVARISAREADARAQRTLSQMTLDERFALLQGFIPQLMPTPPHGVAMAAGYVPGIPRLGIPDLTETDAGLGVANQGGVMRGPDEATAFPSGAAMASTWDVDMAERAGEAMGAEARAKGFNVLLAGGVNLVREPRNGRNFEYMGEDPLLAGRLAGHIVRGVQSNDIASTVKHFAINAQETGRTVMSAQIGEADLRESDLLAFQIAIEIGDPASVMCAYNRLNGVYTCEDPFLLKDVLRRDWDYRGWVMSDWGSVHSASLVEGLDQESGTRVNYPAFFGAPLREAFTAGRVSRADVDRAVLRILRSMYLRGLMDRPVEAGQPIDYQPHIAVAQQIAENGIVLLKNDGGLLPIAASAKRILIIGAHADVGVLGGGGSSQVNPVGGAALSLAIPGEPVYHRRMYMPSSPLEALRAGLPQAAITYDDGTDPARAAAAARDADMVLVFVEQPTAEGWDVKTLSLPDDQDALVDAVAASNPRTVVVLETGGPVLMPWLDKVGAVLAAWYPGQRGGHALARLLTGEVNPSGRLPITFPRDIAQTPNPVLPGLRASTTPTGETIYDLPTDLTPFDVNYPEGSDVGYRWYDRTHAAPLFAFGHGLSYTTFAYDRLSVAGGSNVTATFDLTNTGDRAGVETAQVYARVDGVRRLIGWSRVALAPGERRRVTVTADPRLLAQFDTGRNDWRIDAGRYPVEVSAASDTPKLNGLATLRARRLRP